MIAFIFLPSKIIVSINISLLLETLQARKAAS